MAATNFHVDYDENPDLNAVNEERDAKLTENNTMYDGMITESDKYTQDQIGAVKDYEKEQKKNQQEMTDFAIEQINQQKGQAKKDYIKEQSGAYVDWQKQSNQYGVNAEQKASLGMAGSGYSESSQVSMYNTYQNRVMTAREVYARAVLNYDNAIKDAILQNNAALAEIAFNSLSKQLELSLAGFQYKNTLIIQKAESARQIRNEYFTKWKTMLDQINTENAIAEQARQFDEEMQFAREQAELNSGVIEQNDQPYRSPAETYTSISQQAAKFTSNVARENWLKKQVEDDLLSEEQAYQLYKKYYNLTHVSWTVVDDGGFNGGGGIDNDAKVKDENGHVYSLKELKKALVDQGMAESSAKQYVLKLQSRLLID